MHPSRMTTKHLKNKLDILDMKGDDMKIEYVKAVLYAYPQINNKIKSLTSLITLKAVNSRCNQRPCEEQCMEIIKLQVERELLRLLKNDMDAAFTEQNDKRKFGCLACMYFDRKRYGRNCRVKVLHCHRYNSSVTSKFAKLLEKRGINDKYFEENLLEVKLIRQCLNVVHNDEYGRKRKQKEME